MEVFNHRCYYNILLYYSDILLYYYTTHIYCFTSIYYYAMYYSNILLEYTRSSCDSPSLLPPRICKIFLGLEETTPKYVLLHYSDLTPPSPLPHPRIYKIFLENEEIDSINDQYWTIRAEELAPEELIAFPDDKLIHVRATPVLYNNILVFSILFY